MTRRQVGVRLRLGGLAVVVAGLIFLFVAPMGTISVKVDLPPGVDPVSADTTVNATTNWISHVAVPIVDAGLILTVLGFGAFFARRILRKHREDEAEDEQRDAD